MYEMYENKLFGYGKHSHFQYFSRSDTNPAFLQQLLKENEDWYYRNNEITYKRNKNGHRTNLQISDLKTPYFLTTGCSFTEGIGINYEHTYSYLLSQSLGLENYNIGLSASGWDLLCQNLDIFLKLDIPKPKFIILQWPGFYRYYRSYQNIISCVVANSQNVDLEFLLSEDFKIHQIKIRKDLLDCLNSFKIGYLEYTVEIPMLDIIKQFKKLPIIDKGRDNHPGMKTNKYWSWLIKEDLKNNNFI
jgi:hypothetical protein